MFVKEDFDVVIERTVFYVQKDMSAIDISDTVRCGNVWLKDSKTAVLVRKCLFWRVPESLWWRFRCACKCFWLTLRTGIPHELPEPDHE